MASKTGCECVTEWLLGTCTVSHPLITVKPLFSAHQIKVNQLKAFRKLGFFYMEIFVYP